MKIVAIVGSPRAAGNTIYLVDQALEEAGRLGVETEKILLSQYQINPCQGHDNCGKLEECPQKDDARWILDKFSNADGVILASPVYFYNVTAPMKLFMDRSRFNRRHNIAPKARSIGLITLAGTGGTEPTLEAMERYLKLVGSPVAPEQILTVSGLSARLGEAKEKQELVEAAKGLGRQMAQQLA